jgi:hypothetical protein
MVSAFAGGPSVSCTRSKASSHEADDEDNTGAPGNDEQDERRAYKTIPLVNNTTAR